MLNNYNSYNYKDRNLSEVFEELKNKNSSTTYIKSKTNFKKLKSISFNGFNLISKIKSPHIIGAIIILFAFTALFCNKTIFAKSNSPDYEINKNALDIQNIISKNADVTKFKEQVVIDCNVVYATIYNNNPSLPKGEEVITKEGALGKDKVTYIRTYENKILTEEVILSRVTITKPESQLVDVGTSEFLAKHKIHIGDTLYLTEDSKLKKSTDIGSKDITDIQKSLDVKLLELTSEEWCKVSFEDKEGYIETKKLTSASSSPEIVEENKVIKIKSKVNIDMELNKSSGLTEDDFKKVLSGIPQDTKHIIEDNYKVFYEMDTKYNINGIFLASIAIHESAWGTSTIANNKKNLFGYGAYDSSPYESSYNFTEYSGGIETVAKALVKNYLNPAGTKIYDDQEATGLFYNEPTVKGVNTRYASDKEWYSKVFKYMEMLYDRL